MGSDFGKLNAKPRDNSDFNEVGGANIFPLDMRAMASKLYRNENNHVSCMTCTEFGSSSQDFLGKTFKLVCQRDGIVSSLKELFSDALYGSNTFAFETDGTFSFPNGAGNSGLYQQWTSGTNGKMVWTTHHDTACAGICDLRYTLVDTAAGFGRESGGAVWFTIVNYYEVGEATCNIELVASSSRRLSQVPVDIPKQNSPFLLV